MVIDPAHDFLGKLEFVRLPELRKHGPNLSNHFHPVFWHSVPFAVSQTLPENRPARVGE